MKVIARTLRIALILSSSFLCGYPTHTEPHKADAPPFFTAEYYQQTPVKPAKNTRQPNAFFLLGQEYTKLKEKKK